MSTGIESIAAYAQAATWGTAATVNTAFKKIFITDEDYKAGRIIPETSGPSLLHEYPPPLDTPINGEGPVNMILRPYGEYIQMLADAMGIADTPSDINESGTDGYKHVLGLASSYKFGTLGFDRGSDVWVAKSVKAKGFTLTFNYPEFATMSIDYAGTPPDNTVIADLNSATSTDGSGNETKHLAVYTQKMTLSIGTHGTAIASLSSYDFKGVTLTFTREAEGEHYPGADPFIEEPITTNTLKATLSVEFPVLEAAAAPKHNDIIAMIQNLITTANEYSAVLVWDGAIQMPGTASPNYYRFGIYCPYLILESGANQISGADKIPATLNFQCKGNITSSVPSGWDSNRWNDTFYIEVDNLKSTAYIT